MITKTWRQKLRAMNNLGQVDVFLNPTNLDDFVAAWSVSLSNGVGRQQAVGHGPNPATAVNNLWFRCTRDLRSQEVLVTEDHAKFRWDNGTWRRQ